MAKAAPKTQKNKASVAEFIAAVESDARRKDAKALDKMLRAATGEKPVMWGASIVGYGQYPTPTGSWPRIGFSPRKANLVLYVLTGEKQQAALLKRLGKHKTGKSCLYLNTLADVDEAVLAEIIASSWAYMAARYP